MYSEEFDSKMKTIDSWHKWSNKSIIKFYHSIHSIVLIVKKNDSKKTQTRRLICWWCVSYMMIVAFNLSILFFILPGPEYRLSSTVALVMIVLLEIPMANIYLWYVDSCCCWWFYFLFLFPSLVWNINHVHLCNNSHHTPIVYFFVCFCDSKLFCYELLDAFYCVLLVGHLQRYSSKTSRAR